ncbi:MAG: hypothetical protein Kow0075_10130 [Salibacteraceae bacterium]
MIKTEIIDLVNVPERSDRDLLGDYRKTRDNDLLLALFRKHLALIYGVCIKYMGKGRAEEAVLETFDHLRENFNQVIVEDFRTYLYVLSIKVSKALLENEKPSVVSVGKADIELVKQAPAITDEMISDKRFKPCVEKLEKEVRNCVELFYIKKKNYEQICHETGLPRQQVKDNLLLAKRELRHCMNEES